MQNFFHLAFIVVFLIFFGIRAVYHRKAQQQQGKVEYREEKMTRIRHSVGLLFPLALLTYMVYPRLLGAFDLPLPLWVQWLGLGLGLISIAFITWVHRALDVNFSVILHVRENHNLVTHGPYRFMRHPMYTALFLHGLSVLLMTRNALIGGLYLVSLSAILLLRVRSEEQEMIGKFGPAYLDYRRQTWRFVPRLPGFRASQNPQKEY